MNNYVIYGLGALIGFLIIPGPVGLVVGLLVTMLIMNNRTK